MSHNMLQLQGDSQNSDIVVLLGGSIVNTETNRTTQYQHMFF